MLSTPMLFTALSIECLSGAKDGMSPVDVGDEWKDIDVLANFSCHVLFSDPQTCRPKNRAAAKDCPSRIRRRLMSLLIENCPHRYIATQTAQRERD